MGNDRCQKPVASYGNKQCRDAGHNKDHECAGRAGRNKDHEHAGSAGHSRGTARPPDRGRGKTQSVGENLAVVLCEPRAVLCESPSN